MATISLAEARGIFTDKLQDIYREKTMVTTFLRSFFMPKESNSKFVSIAVMRGTEQIAVDVQRGTEGNRNTFSKSSEKKFLPPYYEEFLEATELDFYDKMWNEDGVVEVTTFKNWLDDIVEYLDELINKIERSTELQCSQVFHTGVIALKAGTNIDFKRKGASIVANNASNTWATGTVSPYKNFEDACIFIRTKGKSMGVIYNAILGSEAMQALLQNEVFLKRNDLQNLSLDAVSEPQKMSDGTLHGYISAGPYTVRLWTYNEYYDSGSTKHIPYIDPKTVIVMPENPRFKLMYAGVPQLLGDDSKTGLGLANKKGKYHISEYIDPRKKSHQIIVEAAPVAVPVAVDQIYTFKPVAP